jgi:NAD-dependent deacetylase
MADLCDATRRQIGCALDIIQGSKTGVVLSGAGISTPSGIPDFRSTDNGLWTRYDPYEVASLSAFRYDPVKVLNWVRPLVNDIVKAEPNEAHYALARLEQSGALQTVITQNIDALHQRAGSNNVLEVHGTIRSVTCTGCFSKFDSQGYLEPFVRDGAIPHCPACGKVLKPDIILFGEQLPAQTWLKALQASKQCDFMIVVGSSLEVLPAAGLPMRSLENGARLIIINRSPTYLDVRADVVFHEDVKVILPELARAVSGD